MSKTKQGADGEREKQPVVVEFDRLQHRWLRQTALDEGTTMSSLIRDAVDETYGRRIGYPRPPES